MITSYSPKQGIGVLKLFGALAIIGLGISVAGVVYLQQWAQNDRIITNPVVFDYKRGTSLRQLSQQLKADDVISSELMFKVWVRAFADGTKFQAGLYRFEGPVSPQNIASKLSKGDIYTPIVVQFSIPEGFNYRMIVPRLVAHGAGTSQELKALWFSPTLLRELKIPSKSFEGFFYPATYSFTKKVNAENVLRHAAKTFWQKLPADYEARAREKGLSLKDAVTFASLIEVETRMDDEREKVSEVIWRRLRNREPLAIDAALIYGIRDYRGDIKWVHLKDAKNKYNTRIHRGLPPTPIASPAIKSLMAVLNPTDEGYYYYVRDVDSDDRHIFSRTLAEHNRHVATLVARTRKGEAQRKKENSSRRDQANDQKR